MQEKQEIYMPGGAEILTVQMQNDAPQIWAIVDDESHLQQRTILIVGTGQEMPKDINITDYLGTFQMEHGRLIFHVFVL
jgi:hypothetical protein